MPPRRNIQNNQNQANEAQNFENNADIVKQFRRYNPLTFNGRDGPTAVEEWFRALERIFRLVRCTTQQRVSCAEFQLVEDADHWWEGYWRSRTEEERDALTWDGFKEIVMQRYFPESYREQMESEFFEFQQGKLTVEQYEREFCRMARFAPHMVDTERKKAQKFMKGLRSEIRSILAGHGDMPFSDLVTRAGKIAASQEAGNTHRKSTENRGKRKWDESSQEEEENHNKQEKTTEGAGPRGRTSRPMCSNCGKNHNGECLLGQNRCFWCKEKGHTIAECPKTKPGGGKGPETGGKGLGTGGKARVFVMGQPNLGT